MSSSGRTIGGWTISAELGRGGNGTVFEAHKDGRTAALKVLHPFKDPARVARFADEIRAMERCKAIPGILPLYESDVAPLGTKRPSWLAMAKATKLSEALGATPTLEHVLTAVRDIAKALTAVHLVELSHRDIKPDNLFCLEGTWCVGDFGLADFAEKESETKPLEKVGPLYYIAPEMLNDALGADGKPADVYSLGKTLWVLASGQRYPLPGHHTVRVPAMTLSAYVDHPRAALLDSLLDACTDFNPIARPTMEQVVRELEAWLAPAIAGPAAVRSDLGEFKRMLEGRTEKLRAHNETKKANTERMKEQGLRVREKFRPIAFELAQNLREAGLLSSDPTIDNYHYGFEVGGFVPDDPLRSESHHLKIAVHTNPDEPVGASFKLNAWYRHVVSTPGAGKDVLLWRSERQFISNGADETVQIQAMIHDLQEQLVPAIRQVLGAAGVLPI